MHKQAAIGVFDSGLGGISVLHEIRRLLPAESLIYVADSAHVPYGEKSTAFIVQRSVAISEFLMAQPVKALVVACNTATAAAVNELRLRWPNTLIVGMEPAIKPAVQASPSGKIGVLATNGTLRSARFAALLERYAADVEVVTQPCPGLVELIEEGQLETAATRTLLTQYVEPLLAAGCDTLILGCTHYPLVKPLLRTLVPAEVGLIDTGEAVARRLHGELGKQGLLTDAQQPIDHFYSSGNVQKTEQTLALLWLTSAPVSALGF
ncbi:MAG TPA: glutamate racemase [Thiopseudomonas sp.]|nr:glutamate racemase [Thiopseudomonas sp.]